MGGKPASWRHRALVGLFASAVLGGCGGAPIGPSVIYTDECQVTFPNGTQSGMEDCDEAQSQSEGAPGSTMQQMITEPDGTNRWVPPTGNWG